jgi:hypothetical protein
MESKRTTRCTGSGEHHQIRRIVPPATVVAGCLAGKQRISQVRHGREKASEVQEGMRFTTVLSMFVFVCACGDDGGGSGGGTDAGNTADAPPAPAMITISGMATKRAGLTETPAEGATVEAFMNSDPNTPVATATVDAAGMYTLTVETGGVAVDGFIKATLADFFDLYLYPPKPLTADYDGASLNIVNTNTVDLLTQICKPNYDETKGLVALIVADSAENPLADAQVTSSPEAPNDCYNGTNGLPDVMAEATQPDSIAYLINVPAGELTVSASVGGTTFGAHKVNARAGAFTTTVIQQ